MVIVSPKRGHNYYLAVIDVWSSTTVLVDACSLMCWNKSCPFVVPYHAFVAGPLMVVDRETSSRAVEISCSNGFSERSIDSTRETRREPG